MRRLVGRGVRVMLGCRLVKGEGLGVRGAGRTGCLLGRGEEWGARGSTFLSGRRDGSGESGSTFLPIRGEGWGERGSTCLLGRGEGWGVQSREFVRQLPLKGLSGGEGRRAGEPA